MAVVGVVIAVLSLLLSVLVAWVQHHQGSRLAAIEEARRQDEVAERQAATLLAQFEDYITSGGRTGHHLVVVNHGPAAAEDVAFKMESDGGERTLPRLIEEPWPISLQVGQRYEIVASVHMGTAPNVRGTLFWRDERGPQQQSVILSL